MVDGLNQGLPADAPRQPPLHGSALQHAAAVLEARHLEAVGDAGVAAPAGKAADGVDFADVDVKPLVDDAFVVMKVDDLADHHVIRYATAFEPLQQTALE